MYRIAILFFIFFCCSTVAEGQTEFTWSEDIGCIIFSHCTNCHNANGVAPFALESYEEVITYKDAILNEVTAGTMPPWPAKSPQSHFVGDHSLSEEEISALDEWIRNGTPAGDMTTAPEAPSFETNIQITDPDHIIELPEYTVPELDDNDLYKCFVFPLDFDEDMFVKAIEVVPGNTRAVHHVLLYHETSNTPINLDNADPEIGYTCFGGIGSNNAQLIGGWAPGGEAQFFPDEMGIKIPGQTNLVVQVHYPAYAHGEVDQTDIRLKLSTDEQRDLVVFPVLNHFTSMLDGPLVIPANTVKTFNQLWTTPTKITITGVAPHAHLICTSMTSWAETPNGEIIDLIDIPNWDFDWQKFYGYKRPIILEPGTKIFGRASYDNTINNHHNPNSPPQLVTLGEDTDEEMMVFFYTFTGYEQGDENLVFEESLHKEHIDGCSFELTGNETLDGDVKLVLYPNPVSKELFIDCTSRVSMVKVFDILGNKVLEREAEDIRQINTSELTAGSYSVQLRTKELLISKIIIVE